MPFAAHVFAGGMGFMGVAYFLRAATVLIKPHVPVGRAPVHADRGRLVRGVFDHEPVCRGARRTEERDRRACAPRGRPCSRPCSRPITRSTAPSARAATAPWRTPKTRSQPPEDQPHRFANQRRHLARPRRVVAWVALRPGFSCVTWTFARPVQRGQAVIPASPPCLSALDNVSMLLTECP